MENNEIKGPNDTQDEIKNAVNSAREAKKTATDAARTARKVTGRIAKAVTFVITNFILIIKIIAISLIVLLALNSIQYIFELINATNTPEKIYEKLGVTDIKELVEIVGNERDGYHLEYVDDIDEKIDQIIDVLGRKSGVYTISSQDKDIIKKMIKAEVITQFPNLAGEYDEQNEEFQGAVKIRRITPNKEIGEFKNTGTGEVTTLGDSEQDAIIKDENVSNNSDRIFNSSGRETIGDENKIYVMAIAAGHNNTDDKGVTVSDEFVEEEMTIKVAEKVEEICKKYRNLIVVQTGSTTENPGGVSKQERVTLAKAENPDLCIQIHFNSGEGYGVEAHYEYGDGYSATLAQMVSNKLAEKMGLENRGTITNENNSDYYETIDSYYQTNFPSIITLGGFLNNENEQEVLRNGGIDKYAEAIVEGAIEYLRADHSNESVTFVQGATQTSGIESRVYDLKYLPEEDFKSLVDGNSKEALKYFTLDESYNVVTANWTVDGNNVKISNNSPYNLRSTLQNVTMPYEYLLYFLIDSGNKEFVRDLATLVEDTEIIMAVQDNITTTRITAEVQQRIKATVEEKTTEWAKNETRSQEESSFMEYCRTSVSITYADTWFVRYTKSGDSYSANSLGIQKDDLVDKIVNVRGKVTEQTSTEEKGYGAEGPYEVGERKYDSYQITVPVEKQIPTSRATVNQLEDESKNQSNGESNSEEQKYETKTINYSYVTQERYKKTIYTISNLYEEGESVVEDNINKFVNLYNKYKMANCVKEKWLFKILEGNTKTANMVDLTKYLIFQATGISYGVEEFDFSVFDISKFNDISSMGGLSLLIEYLHQWENASGPKTNADGTKYIIETDGYGNPTVGYGVDIFNGGFAEIFEQAGYPTHIGGEVDKEFVDALEQQELQENLEAVRSATSGLNLTEYQIHALVSRAYNCGVAGAISYTRGSPALNFVNSYNRYWNAETDDLYEERNNKADFNHILYKQYMSVPVTAKKGNRSVYSEGLENRRKSEWTLFQTGYYDRIDKWYQEGGDIIAVADFIHKYMEENNYIYCVYGSNSYEECGKFGKSHGLDSTFEKSKTGHQKTCCATYVSWVLQETGHITASDHTNGATAMKDVLVGKGWIKINSVSELQPGDVLYYSYGHVEIYAGDGKVYNAGSGNAIRGASPQTNAISSMTFGLRAPN